MDIEAKVDGAFLVRYGLSARHSLVVADDVAEAVIAGASALVFTSYLVCCGEDEPMLKATLQAIDYAKCHNVPVVLTLGQRRRCASTPTSSAVRC